MGFFPLRGRRASMTIPPLTLKCADIRRGCVKFF